MKSVLFIIVVVAIATTLSFARLATAQDAQSGAKCSKNENGGDKCVITFKPGDHVELTIGPPAVSSGAALDRFRLGGRLAVGYISIPTPNGYSGGDVLEGVSLGAEMALQLPRLGADWFGDSWDWFGLELSAGPYYVQLDQSGESDSAKLAAFASSVGLLAKFWVLDIVAGYQFMVAGTESRTLLHSHLAMLRLGLNITEQWRVSVDGFLGASTVVRDVNKLTDGETRVHLSGGSMPFEMRLAINYWF